MNYAVINGKAYDVLVTSLEESFDITHSENAGRTIAEGTPMVLDPLGTFFGHTVTFKRLQGKESEFDKLFNAVAMPRSKGVPVKIAHDQAVIAYDAYISTGTRKLERITKDGKVLWGELSVKFTPITAQWRPSSTTIDGVES